MKPLENGTKQQSQEHELLEDLSAALLHLKRTLNELLSQPTQPAESSQLQSLIAILSKYEVGRGVNSHLSR